MTRPALAALVLALTVLGPVSAQGFPFDPPKPLGGPIVGPDGQVLSGMNKGGPWGGGVDFGISGSSGNVDIQKVRAGLDITYNDSGNSFLINGLYVLSRQSNEIIEQKGLVNVRDELLFDPNWAYYAQGQLEYDQFRDPNFRLAAHNGLTYISDPVDGVKFKVRAGVGASREWGSGPLQDWIPEAQFGADYEYLISKRTKFSLIGDYYPEVTDFASYRLRARAVVDILLDPELNLLLRLGVQDRYDSRTYQTKPNDLDYFVSLMFRF